MVCQIFCLNKYTTEFTFCQGNFQKIEIVPLFFHEIFILSPDNFYEVFLQILVQIGNRPATQKQINLGIFRQIQTNNKTAETLDI